MRQRKKEDYYSNREERILLPHLYGDFFYNFYVVSVQIGHISYNFLGNSSKRYLHFRH